MKKRILILKLLYNDMIIHIKNIYFFNLYINYMAKLCDQCKQ